MFVISGQRNPGHKRWFATSTDLATWTYVEGGGALVLSARINEALVSDGVVYAVDENGYVITSADSLVTFSQIPLISGLPQRVIGAEEGNPTFNTIATVASTGRVWSSPDGATFTEQGPTQTNPREIIWTPFGGGTGTWIEVASAANPQHTVDLNNWFPCLFPAGYGGGERGCYDADNGVAVIISSAGVYTSPDAATFTKVANNPEPATLQKVRRLGGLTWICASGTTLHSSSDNVTWSGNLLAAFDPFTYGIIRDIAYDGTTFMVITSGGFVLSSTDGTTWTQAYDFSVDTVFPTLWCCFVMPRQGHGFFRYPLYWDQIAGEARR